MSITATVQNGVVRLPEGVHLPDGTRVVVDIIERRSAFSSGSLADSLSTFAGVADDLPSDLARRMCGLAERLGDLSIFMTPGELHSLRSDRTLTWVMGVLEQQLAREVESVPESLQREVLDFVLFLKHKHLGSGIEKTPGVCGGEACVAGTRIAVWMLEEARRAGATDQDLLQDYPGLDAKRLSEAWSYVHDHPEEIERAIAENALV